VLKGALLGLEMVSPKGNALEKLGKHEDAKTSFAKAREVGCTD